MISRTWHNPSILRVNIYAATTGVCRQSRVLDRSCVKAPSSSATCLPPDHTLLAPLSPDLYTINVTTLCLQIKLWYNSWSCRMFLKKPVWHMTRKQDSSAKIPTGSVHINHFDLASLSCFGCRGVMMYYCEQSEHFKRWPSFSSIC